MEKLIIKNFGPILDIEIDINKYVILIGDTSTGKSIIAKLIAIFREIALTGIDNRDEFNSFLNKYNIPFFSKTSILEYKLDKSSIKVTFQKINTKNLIDKTKLEKIKKLVTLIDRVSELVDDNKNNEILEKISDLEKNLGNLTIFRNLHKLSPIYIPAERIIFSMVKDSLAGLWANNVSLAQCYKEFAASYEKARNRVKNFSYSPLNIEYFYDEKDEYVRYNDKKISLNQTSSGIQSLIPLLLVLKDEKENEFINNDDFFKTIIIEEPELNLFPVRQKELLEYIVRLFNKINFGIVITTHSPYIISSFNNLILANNSFKQSKRKKKLINNIVVEDLWVNYENISVYEVKDGKIINLKDDEFKNINTNAIDTASDLLSIEADKLIDIRYEG